MDSPWNPPFVQNVYSTVTKDQQLTEPHDVTMFLLKEQHQSSMH